MHNIKKYTFGKKLHIEIKETPTEEYGTYTWPSAILLAEYIYQHRSLFEYKNILELGCGTALPGILASKLKATVILSDKYEDSKEITTSNNLMTNLKCSCKLNSANCKLIPLTWGSLQEEEKEEINSLNHLDFIIGADVLYDKKNFNDLFATISFLISKNKKLLKFLTVFHIRTESYSYYLHHCINSWGLKAKKIDISHLLSFENNLTSRPERFDSLELIEVVGK